MATKANNFLTREQIDEVISKITSRDLFAALPAGETAVNGGQIAGKVFEAAAERQGHGKEALDRVSIGDGIYLASALGELFSDGPKEEPTGDSPASPATGD